MQDITLVCKDCGNEFVWTAGEQEFYQQKGLVNQPVRCPECRKKRKADRPAGYDKPEQTQKAVQPVFALLRAFQFYIQFPTPPLNIWVPSG